MSRRDRWAMCSMAVAANRVSRLLLGGSASEGNDPFEPPDRVRLLEAIPRNLRFEFPVDLLFQYSAHASPALPNCPADHSSHGPQGRSRFLLLGEKQFRVRRADSLRAFVCLAPCAWPNHAMRACHKRMRRVSPTVLFADVSGRKVTRCGAGDGALHAAFCEATDLPAQGAQPSKGKFSAARIFSAPKFSPIATCVTSVKSCVSNYRQGGRRVSINSGGWVTMGR